MKLKENHINYCEHHSKELNDTFGEDVKNGLSRNNKYLPCKYIYDNEGSRLFQEIMDLPEYYLTDCEAEILKNNGDFFISEFEGIDFDIVELGAGDGIKTEILLNHFIEKNIDVHYVPIDISSCAVEDLITRLSNRYESLRSTGLVTEYFQGLKYLSEIDSDTKLVLFLGSNIGNMNPEQSNEFLSSIYNSLNPGDYLLVGFDLKKDAAILNKAYNDSRGITAEFNMNLLKRINNELGGNFNFDKFKFYSTYEPYANAVRSYLISTENQIVTIEDLDMDIAFNKYEPVHTESSHKYIESDIENFASKNGFTIIKNFYDSKNFFADSLWQIK